MNINKYKNRKFCDNIEINKKIIALFLLFDKTVEDLNLNRKKSLELINSWILVFLNKEEYEIAEAFKRRKQFKIKKLKKKKRKISFKLLFRFLRYKISKF